MLRAICPCAMPAFGKMRAASDEPVRPDYMTPNVRLLGYRAIGRVCDVCYDTARPDLLPIGRAVTSDR